LTKSYIYEVGLKLEKSCDQNKTTTVFNLTKASGGYDEG